MKRMKKFLLLISFFLLVTTGFNGCFDDSKNNDIFLPEFSADTKADFQAAVDSAYSSATHKRGVSVAVYKDGYAVWTYSTGYSDGTMGATTDTAMTAATPGYAYSITKTFISALVLSQVEDGEYNLTDTVSSLLAGQSDYDSFSADIKTNKINVNATVADLLKHTTGMPDYASNVSALVAMCDPAFSWKPASIITNVVNSNFDATKWANRTFEYSNTNYVLLGMIAEYKGGKNLNTLLAENFFNRLGISAALTPQDSVPSTIAHPFDDTAILGAAYGFMDMTVALYGAGYTTYNYYTGVGRSTWAAGGIVTTAENLAKWGYQLYDTDGTAVSTAVRTQLKNSATTDGAYGYGVSYNTFTYDDSTQGEKYGHGGSAPGYKTLLRYETANRISVAIMTNINNSYGAMTTPTANDAQLGIIDREALAEDLFNAYNNNN